MVPENRVGCVAGLCFPEQRRFCMDTKLAKIGCPVCKRFGVVIAIRAEIEIFDGDRSSLA